MFAWSWRGASLAAAVIIGAIAVSVMPASRTGEPSPVVARATTPAAPVVAEVESTTPKPGALRKPHQGTDQGIELGQLQPAGWSISQLSVRPLDDIAPIVVPSIPQSEGGR